jgi:hypothetical protein
VVVEKLVVMALATVKVEGDFRWFAPYNRSRLCVGKLVPSGARPFLGLVGKWVEEARLGAARDSRRELIEPVDGIR